MNKVYVAQSPIHGQGLFAADPIAQGDYIGFYQGNETMDNDVYVLWVKQGEDEKGEDIWLGYAGTGELRFLNHSPQPNCEFDGQELYSVDHIAAGDELTFDYGEWFEAG